MPEAARQQGPALFPSGVVCDRFRIDGVLGVGGTGTVFRALDLEREEIVALKAIPHDATLRQRARGNSITSGIGRLFDLTAAIESSSLPPTEMQQRSIEASVTEFADIVAKVNDVVANKMPALRIRALRLRWWRRAASHTNSAPWWRGRPIAQNPTRRKTGFRRRGAIGPS